MTFNRRQRLRPHQNGSLDSMKAFQEYNLKGETRRDTKHQLGSSIYLSHGPNIHEFTHAGCPCQALVQYARCLGFNRCFIQSIRLLSLQPPVCDYPRFITLAFRLAAEEEEGTRRAATCYSPSFRGREIARGIERSSIEE